MTLVEADNIDQSVCAQARRLRLQRGDPLGLARIRRQPESRAPRIYPNTPHDDILTRCERAAFIDLDFVGGAFDATLRGGGAAGECAYRNRYKR